MSAGFRNTSSSQVVSKEDLTPKFKLQRDAAYAKIRELEKEIKILQLEKELEKYKNVRDRN